MCEHAYTNTYTNTHACMHACMHAYAHARIHTCMHAYTYGHTCTHTQIHAHTRAYIQTHMPSFVIRELRIGLIIKTRLDPVILTMINSSMGLIIVIFAMIKIKLLLLLLLLAAATGWLSWSVTSRRSKNRTSATPHAVRRHVHLQNGNVKMPLP